jgi:hypothetical protein
MHLDAVWFHVVGTGAKWCHPYIAFMSNGSLYLAEIWQLPITWAKLEKNPPSEIFGMYDVGGSAWIKDSSLCIHSQHMAGNRELLHAVSYWLIDKFPNTTKRPTLSGTQEGNFFKVAKAFTSANPFVHFDTAEVKGKQAIVDFCAARNWMVHPSDIAVNSYVSSRELEEISDRLHREVRARTPSGVYTNTRCSHCWLKGELLKCSECAVFSCCITCHNLLKVKIIEAEVVCVQCVFEEQGVLTESIQSTRPEVRTLA